jgi:Porin PorA
MRQISGYVASGLGAFLLVLALLTRFYLVDRVIKYPLNEYQVEALNAAGATYFSAGQLKEVSGVTMREIATVKGDVAAGNSNRAVWQEFDYVYDVTHGKPFGYALQRLAFNRRTGVLIKCCGEFVTTTAHTDFPVAGQAYSWPFGTQKRTYLVFNNTIDRPVPARYEGTATVDGLTTYKFVQQIPATQFGTTTLPGSLVAEKSQALVTLGEYAVDTVTDYVDPVSGGPVKSSANENLTLRDSSGVTRLLLLRADFTMSPSTIAGLVQNAKSGDAKIQLISSILPGVCGLLGVLLLIIGPVLLRSRKGGGADPEQSGEGAYAPVDTAS